MNTSANLANIPVWQNKSLANLEGEVWKSVIGYEGLYEVSSLGRVKSLDRKRRSKNNSLSTLKGRVLSQNIDKYGYLYVCLTLPSSKGKNLKIHRIVAIAYIDNPKKLPEVNHLKSKLENKPEFLEWITSRGNSRHHFLRDNKSSSRFIGVSWDKARKKWRAKFYLNKKFIHLGSFDSEVEASEAYQIYNNQKNINVKY